MEIGRIIKNISNQYEVLTDTNERIPCYPMGKLRRGFSPIVGDFVEYEKKDDRYVIQKVLPRKNQLRRPLISNIDQAIIVMSAVDPDFSCALLDRLIFLITYENITPIICITKLDLIEKDSIVYSYIEDYKKSGYTVLLSGKGFSTKDVEDILTNKVSVLTGQSGAGKSSLINRIDDSFELQTQKISKALGRGKHTTRHSELYEINGGWLGDTPGFSSLDFTHVEPLKLATTVPDFKPYIGQCKFNDCIHENEPECKVKEALEEGKVSKIRYKSYVEVLNVIKNGNHNY